MKKALWAIIIAIILAIIAFFVYFFNNTDQEFGTIGAPIAFTLFYEEGNEAWMPIFEKQLEKWNNIHPIFSIKERIKITSSTPIINAKNDGINAVYLGTLPGFANDLAPGRSQTDDPIDGKLFGGDIAIKPHLSHSELAVGECNIGYQPPIEGVGTSFNPTFSQVALHELSHFIGLTHSSGINISNVNIVIDSDLRARDKKLWNTIAYLNFNKSQDYFDCGIFRGFKQFGAELPCPSTTPTSVTPNEQLTLNNVNSKIFSK